MARLNGWQRLWVVVVVLLVLPASLLVKILWPSRDVSVVTDLTAAECDPWRKLPAGFAPSEYPSSNEPCRALQGFLYVHQVPVKTVADYDSWLLKQKWKAVGWGVLIWLGVSAFIYLMGWAVAWVRRGFRGKTA